MSFLSQFRKAPLLILGLTLLPLLPAHAAEPSDPGPDPEVQKRLAAAQKLFAKKDFKKAVRELEEANQRASGQCGACLLGLAQAKVALGDREGATRAARAAVALGGPRRFAATAYNQLGVILIQPKAEEAQLTEAEASLRKAVELGDSMAPINLAALQLRRGHPGKTLALARQYLAADPQGRATTAAHILVCHARAVLAEGAPGESLAETATPPHPMGLGVEPPKNLYRELPPGDKVPPGVVALDSVIDEEGCIVEAKVSDPGKVPTLEDAALQAARYWVFQPATVQGRPVRVAYHIIVDSRSRAASPSFPGFTDPTQNPYAITFSAADIADIRRRGSYATPP